MSSLKVCVCITFPSDVKGLTTYDYVMLQRRREKEREEEAKRELQEEEEEEEQEEEEEEEEQDYHGRCWFLRRKVHTMNINHMLTDIDSDHEINLPNLVQ